jgi:flagellar biosynthesis/type III secretory pathway protein FliH
MKKFDLARRANRATPKGFGIDAAELFQQGYEDGYRAARADLRRVLQAHKGSQKSPCATFAGMVGAVWIWLRPIR